MEENSQAIRLELLSKKFLPLCIEGQALGAWGFPQN